MLKQILGHSQIQNSITSIVIKIIKYESVESSNTSVTSSFNITILVIRNLLILFSLSTHQTLSHSKQKYNSKHNSQYNQQIVVHLNITNHINHGCTIHICKEIFIQHQF